ncbi:MAG: S-layer homology domain-containing protein [Oscillibacter sp.]|nr:S-layer homology domain-containing protein [Oscillibacter sp.]
MKRIIAAVAAAVMLLGATAVAAESGIELPMDDFETVAPITGGGSQSAGGSSSGGASRGSSGGGSVTTRTAKKTSFTDVAAGAWYEDAAALVSSRGLMIGTSETTFTPNGPFTRAQFAVVLWRIAGEPRVTGEDSFTDTPKDAWYADAVLWAEQNGVTTGVGGGRYAPNEPVRQQQLVTMLWRMEGEPKSVAASDASEYAAAAVGWARALGIAPTTGEYVFAPQTTALRGQIAVVLAGYLKFEESEGESMVLTAAGKKLDVKWADNSSVDALRALLKKGDLTLDMSDYGGFEKGAALPEVLPQNNEEMNAQSGDVILYQGSQFVIYYGQNNWSLTPLGKIRGMSAEALRALLGTGNVTATLSLS